MTRLLLLDTHLPLWWLNDDPCLPGEVVSQVQTENVETCISQVSLWEMAIKEASGTLEIKGGLAQLEQQVSLQGFYWLQLQNSHILKVAALKVDGKHQDPFDRLLVAQSQVEQMHPLTCDKQLTCYPTRMIFYPRVCWPPGTRRTTSQ